MRKSDAVRIAEIQSMNNLVTQVLGIAKNPLVVSVGLFILIEKLKTAKTGPAWLAVSETAKLDVLEAALFASPILVAAFQSGVIGEALKVGGDAVGAVSKALPLLAAG